MLENPETDGQPLPLYRRLIGAYPWSLLPAPVRAMHEARTVWQASGHFSIRRGSNPVSRLMGWLAAMPPAGDNVHTVLTVTPDALGERWHRQFGHSVFETYQRADNEFVFEQSGPLTLILKVSVDNGTLIMQSVGVLISASPLEIRLPPWMAPSIVASEKSASDGSSRVSVGVAVTHPIWGLIIAYDGFIDMEGRGDAALPSS